VYLLHAGLNELKRSVKLEAQSALRVSALITLEYLLPYLLVPSVDNKAAGKKEKVEYINSPGMPPVRDARCRPRGRLD